MSDADFSEGDEDVAMGSQAVVDTRKHARAQHNALERRRRDNIKDMYSALKDTIPGMSAERASRAVVLKNAVDMITQMENHLKKIVSENEQLEKENAELEAEIAKYEKVVCQSSTTDESSNRQEITNYNTGSMKSPTYLTEFTAAGEDMGHVKSEIILKKFH